MTPPGFLAVSKYRTSYKLSISLRSCILCESACSFKDWVKLSFFCNLIDQQHETVISELGQ